MKLSTRSTYGLKAFITLAEEYQNDNLISLSIIAKRIGCTDKYLEQIMMVLKPLNLFSSQRGSKGGYKLNIDPNLISVGVIIRELENDLKIVDCIDNCKNGTYCSAHNVWKTLYDKINDTLNSITLGELINKTNNKEEKDEINVF